MIGRTWTGVVFAAWLVAMIPGQAETSTSENSFGSRTFTVIDSSFSTASWLTIGLHSRAIPVHLRVSGPVSTKVCPAGLNGKLGALNSSWPQSWGFDKCRSVPKSGRVTLPLTDGLSHVAFAVRPVKATRRLGPLRIEVSYTAADAFVEIIPPAVKPPTDLTVTYTPRSMTTGAMVNPVGGLGKAVGYDLAVFQGGRNIVSPARCDFGSEIDCLGTVTASMPVTVHLTGPGRQRVTLSLSWL